MKAGKNWTLLFVELFLYTFSNQTAANRRILIIMMDEVTDNTILAFYNSLDQFTRGVLKNKPDCIENFYMFQKIEILISPDRGRDLGRSRVLQCCFYYPFNIKFL